MGQVIGGGGCDGRCLCDHVSAGDRGERRHSGEYYGRSHGYALVVE